MKYLLLSLFLVSCGSEDKPVETPVKAPESTKSVHSAQPPGYCRKDKSGWHTGSGGCVHEGLSLSVSHESTTSSTGANNYCSELTEAHQTDWRLPTLDEAQVLFVDLSLFSLWEAQPGLLWVLKRDGTLVTMSIAPQNYGTVQTGVASQFCVRYATRQNTTLGLQ